VRRSVRREALRQGAHGPDDEVVDDPVDAGGLPWVSTASRIAAYEPTMPVSVTVWPSLVTTTFESSTMALRLNALPMRSATSLGVAWVVEPTPPRTGGSAAWLSGH
jgi:hypothetical protein